MLLFKSDVIFSVFSLLIEEITNLVVSKKLRLFSCNVLLILSCKILTECLISFTSVIICPWFVINENNGC